MRTRINKIFLVSSQIVASKCRRARYIEIGVTGVLPSWTEARTGSRYSLLSYSIVSSSFQFDSVLLYASYIPLSSILHLLHRPPPTATIIRHNPQRESQHNMSEMMQRCQTGRSNLLHVNIKCAVNFCFLQEYSALALTQFKPC